MKTYRSTLAHFARQPRLNPVLAFLCFVLGTISISGLVPVSSSRHYFPGHEWVLAILSWVLSTWFSYCALGGLKVSSDTN
ncbi:MAG TPA: hypothetical protein VF928_13995 [Usitatibacteraceae bacterium]